jgi:hypothetical protein
MTFTTRTGSTRCGQCDVVASMSTNPQKRGKPVFRFRFHTNAMCNIGPRGCAALATMGGGVQGVTGMGPVMPGPQAGGGFLAIPGR